MKRNKIKAVIFDIGGVLAMGNLSKGKDTSSKGVHEFVAKKLNVSLDQYFDSIDTTYSKSITGELTEKEVVSKFSKNFKITSKKLKEFYKKSYEKNFKTNKELYQFAFKLKKEGYKIAIL